MQELVNALQNLIASSMLNAPFVLYLIALLWIIHIVNALVGYRLNLFGIHPRTWHGLFGIILCPFLHSDFNHLFFNTIPLFILALLVLLNGYYVFFFLTIFVTITSGAVLWLAGRNAIYIGASSLIMGYFGYLLASAYQNPSIITIVTAVVCLYYLGGLVFSLFPSEKGVAWEGHILGFIAGVAVAFIL